VSQLGSAPEQDGSFGTLKRPTCSVVRFLLLTVAALRAAGQVKDRTIKPGGLQLLQLRCEQIVHGPPVPS